MNEQQPGKDPEDRGLVTRFGPIEIDWPKSIGYYGGVGLAVAFELIEPPLAIFIAAIPLLKLVKNPSDAWPLRVAADVLEGAAKPVGGDAEGVVRVSDNANGNGSRRRGVSRKPSANGSQRSGSNSMDRRQRGTRSRASTS